MLIKFNISLNLKSPKEVIIFLQFYVLFLFNSMSVFDLLYLDMHNT